LGPVTDIVVTGGVFDSPGRFRIRATCVAPGELRIDVGGSIQPYRCTTEGRVDFIELQHQPLGRTLVEVDGGVLDRWQVVIEVASP
jgi:hypothetical protein